MGHANSDRIEEALWDGTDTLHVAVVDILDSGNTTAAIKRVQLIFEREISSLLNSLDDTEQLRTKAGDFRQQLRDYGRKARRGNISEEKVFELFARIREYIDELIEKVHEFFSKDLPDYNYYIRTKDDELEGLQHLQKFSEKSQA